MAAWVNKPHEKETFEESNNQKLNIGCLLLFVKMWTINLIGVSFVD